GNTAARLDAIKTGRSIITPAAQHYPDNFRAMCARCATKQNVDGRTMSILARPSREHRHVILDHQMMIRRCTIDAAGLITFLMPGTDSRKISAAAQNLGQHGLRSHMHHYKNRSIEFLRQMLGKLTQSVHSAGGSANDDDVAFGHEESRPS